MKTMTLSLGVVAALVAWAAVRTTATAKPATRITVADEIGYATVNGLRMYYEEHGSGPTLVLLHGGGSTAQTSFGAIIPRLARTHHVIAPEQQAHGHSGDRDRPLSFEQMADDTAALLAQLGVADADVLGFSNGGVVAMQLAMRHPRLVRRLIVCSSYYAHAGMSPQFWRGFAHATMADMPAPLRAAFVASAPNPAEVSARFAKQVALMEAFRDIPEDSLRAITAKSLVMVGDKDVMSVEHAAQLARLLPHGELAVMPGSAHGTYLGAAETARPGSPLVDLAVMEIEAFFADKL
ncbi:MAG TPA: alpha/beta hydrolase [Polyangia bacterium]|jgi:pimeloyl-ACP methyl ester carboxylesterase